MTQQEIERLLCVAAPYGDGLIRELADALRALTAAPTDQQGSPPGKGEHDGGRLFKCTDAARRDVQGPASLVAGVTNFGAAAPPTEGAIPREPVLWLRMLADTPDWGEDCCHVDADGLSLDTYNDELDPGAGEKYWALPLYRIDAAPKATEGAAMEALRELIECLDLKDRSYAISPVEPGFERELIMEEFRHRWPKAITAARALLAIAPPNPESDPGVKAARAALAAIAP